MPATFGGANRLAGWMLLHLFPAPLWVGCLRAFSRRFAAVLFAACVSQAMFAAEEAATKVAADPALVPERIALSLTATPATSVAVTWRTRAAVAKATVQLAKATPQSTLAEKSETRPAASESVSAGTTTAVWHHSAFLDRLAANTIYAYRVGDGTTWSEWSHFRTAQSEPAAFRFLYFGDPQNGVKEYCTRVFRAAFAQAADSAFYLIAGDLVTTTVDDELWGELFHALGPLGPSMPGMNSPGNHDYGQFLLRGQKTKMASPLFRAHFTQPENGPAGLEETTYHVDYQGVRFVCLNGNERLEDQAAWLDALLAKNPNRWTIVFMHQPVYSTGKARDNPKLRAALIPIYDRHAVDLVLQGHDHSYGRTYKLRAGERVADRERGTVYAVSVTGPKFYPVNPQHAALMAKIDTGTQLYQVISVDAQRLRYEAFTVTGERYDAFELAKPAAR